jgi:hypothetical protein
MTFVVPGLIKNGYCVAFPRVAILKDATDFAEAVSETFDARARAELVE